MPNTLVGDKDKAKNKFLTGDQLRDRTWRLLAASSGDYSPKFIGKGPADLSDDTYRSNTDGLIRTPYGYYRLAEDTRDGTRILLHSYQRQQLSGARNKEGNITLPAREDSEYDIYGLTARQSVDGSIFRDDMSQDIRFLQGIFKKDLNLHAEEIAKDEDCNQPHVVKFVNGRYGLAIFEKDDGTWAVRHYQNLRKDWDEASQFVSVEEKAPRWKFAKWLSLGQDIRKDFETYEDAFAYVRRYTKTAATALFKGKPLRPEPTTLKEKIARRILDFCEQKKYRDWISASTVGVIAGTISTIVSGTPFLGALFGLGATTGWVVIPKVFENTMHSIWQKLASKSDAKRLNSLKPYEEKNLIENYLRQDKENQLRARKKLDPDSLQHLRLLNHNEGQMNYDDGVFTPKDNPHRDIEALSTAANRYFGALFDSSHADRGILTAIYPNGLVSITQVDVETRDTRSYLTYREEFNTMSGADAKHLDPGLTKLPTNGPVHKVTHHQGQDFRYVSIDERGLIADLMYRIGDDAKDFRAFGMKLTDIFGIEDPDSIQPMPAHGLPIKQDAFGEMTTKPPASPYATQATL